MEPGPYSVYLHIPFCRRRCAYCDFNTYAGLEDLHAAYIRALEAEIHYLGQQAATRGEPHPLPSPRRGGGTAAIGRPHGSPLPTVVDRGSRADTTPSPLGRGEGPGEGGLDANRRLSIHTVYFGGGTPSLLAPAHYERLLTALADAFHLLPDAEITLEANPGTVDTAYLAALRGLGFNRLSLGMQSARPEELRLLGREHDFPAVIRAVAAARKAGFANLNLDLIYGLPGQRLEDWQTSLEWALRLAPEHLSLYALTLEHGTPLRAWVQRGLVPPIDDDAAADMYEWAAERLERAGFQQYEISNWARPGFACRHNLQYWRSQPYLGLGAGAHGWVAGQRTVNVRAPAAYIARLQNPPARPVRPFPWTPATVHLRRLSRGEALGEYMMMALRLTREGARWDEVRRRFGVEPRAVFADALERCTAAGLLEPTPTGVRLTPRGRLLANRVFAAFLPEPEAVP